MRIQSSSVAILIVASSIPAVSAFTGLHPSKLGNRRTHAQKQALHKSVGTALYTVTNSKSDTENILDVVDNEIEEKAWKIIKDKSDASIASSSSSSSDAPVSVSKSSKPNQVVEPIILDENDLVTAIEEEASNLVDEMALDFDETCEIDEEGEAVDEMCMDESKLSRAKEKLKGIIGKTLGLVRTGGGSDDLSDGEGSGATDDFQIIDFEDGNVPEGELLERGWEERGNSSALRRNAEVWKFALSCVFKALKPKKLRKKGASEEEIQGAKKEAAIFIRNGLLRLGPSFVKLVSVYFGPVLCMIS